MDGKLGGVISAISDPFRLLASWLQYAVFVNQLATWGVEIQLGKLEVKQN